MSTVISFGGLIASGKSTLIRQLQDIAQAAQLRCRYMEELVATPTV